MLFNLIQVLPRRARVDLGAIVKKGGALHSPKLQHYWKPYHQIVLVFISRDTHWAGSLPLCKNDAFMKMKSIVFYFPSSADSWSFLLGWFERGGGKLAVHRPALWGLWGPLLPWFVQKIVCSIPLCVNYFFDSFFYKITNRTYKKKVSDTVP